MTEISDYKEANNWSDKIRIMALYHYTQVGMNNKWYAKDTARYFDVAISTVTENLWIAEHLGELKDIGSRNKALKKLRGK
jgi:hypothetical protein